MVGGRNWAESKFNLATFKGGTGRRGRVGVQGVHARGRDGERLRPPEGLGAVRRRSAIPDCPDPTSSDGIWHPVNAEGSGTGTLESATAHSVNTVFAQVIAQLGPEKVVDIAQRLGIESSLPAACSITLGSVGVNPLEMTQASRRSPTAACVTTPRRT